MRLIVPLSPSLLLATATAPPALATPPVVVELYQRQGCSSCPPADAVLNALAARGDVIALNLAVAYWDQSGWKDTVVPPATPISPTPLPPHPLRRLRTSRRHHD